MPVETFNYIADLDPNYPGASDAMLQGDDHIRGIKTTLLNTFPNLDAATNVTPTQLTDLGTKSFTAGDIKMQGHGTIQTGWLECNGANVSRSTYSALFAAIGTSWGTGDGSTTFTLPDFSDRYPRGRSGTHTVGSTLAQSVQSHTHTATASNSVTASGSTDTAASHSHTAGTLAGTTDSQGNHIHVIGGSVNVSAGGGYTAVTSDGSGATSYSAAGGIHTHSVAMSGSTASGGSHSHTLTLSVGVTTTVTVNSTGDTETRPATAVVTFVIKT